MPQLRVIRIMNTNLTNDMLNLMTKRQFNIFYTIEFSFQLKIDGNRFLKNVLRLTDKREVSRISFGIQWFKSADIAPYYGYLSKIKSDFDRPQIIYLFLSSESKNLGFQNNMPRKLFSILNQRFKLKAGE